MRIRTALLATALAALSGCAGCDSVPDDAVTDCDAQIAPGGAATDILFVVDDSGSMSQEQEELAANLGAFIDALVNAPVRLDVRVGVTNTSVHGFAPANQTTYAPASPSAGVPYPAGTIVAVVQDPEGVGSAGKLVYGWDPAKATTTWGGARILSNGPNLTRDFKANVLQGISGSGKEQPLAAMALALGKASNVGDPNFGFLRAGARLAVVILTDEDDCSSPLGSVTNDTCRTSGSLYPLADYVTTLAAVAETAGTEPPIVALIAGYDAAGNLDACRGADFVPPTATSALSQPTRLNAFLAELDAASPGVDRTHKDSICRNFGPALLDIANRIIPQTVPLEQAPTDWRMLAVAVDRGGTTVPCRLALSGSTDEATADAVYLPPQSGAAATLTFQHACRLAVGDRVDLRIVCAR
jgi:hypothetical protein